MKKKLFVMMLLVISLGVWGCVPSEDENYEKENTQTEVEKEETSKEEQLEETFDDDLNQSVTDDEEGVYSEEDIDGSDIMTEESIGEEPDGVEAEFNDYDEEITE